MRTGAVLLSLLLISPAVSAGLAEDADAYLQQAVREHSIPSLAAGILVDGEILWTGAAGFADLDARTPATPDTVYRIASISKVLTAVAVLQLAEKGRIELDAAVQEYLPDYPAPRKGTMTIRHLLAHTSGIRHSRGDESRMAVEHYDTLRDACRFFENRKPASVPGTKYRYSSYGYTVLGAVVEAITGSSFEAYMRENVWAPAGMKHTGLDRRPADVAGVARLYRLDGGEVVPDVENDLSLIYPGGGMVSTAGDLLRFVAAQDDGTLLSAEWVSKMFEHPMHDGKALDEHGGLGWNVWDHEAHGRILSRIGGQSGASALLLSYRDRGVTVALLANVVRLDPIWELTNHLIGMGRKAKSTP